MKTRFLPSILLTFILALGACSPFTITNISGERPTPVVEVSGHQPVAVDHVEVQVGIGSPIPVEIVASGTWPDLCSQIAEVQSEVNGFEINVTVLASTTPSCPPDQVGLPFRFAIPLNIIEMPEGTYTVTVNGSSTTFEVPVQ